MVKMLFICFFLVMPFSLFSQAFEFRLNGVIYDFKFNQRNDSLFEKIMITNTSKEKIYLPLHYQEDIYFFHIQNEIYSYTGQTNHKYGQAGLGGWVNLFELDSGDTFTLELLYKFQIQDTFKNIYYFSIDYITDSILEEKQLKLNIDGMLREYEYSLNCYSFYSKIR